ncbi:MAG: ABC transporter permease [Deltaproteobacteria bacterium]|nr:ABC transporter permease [Deltaproteobacteria bacterium]
MKVRNVKAIARKEFYHLLRDFRSLYLAFAIPLVLILLFGYALSLDVDNIETIVVDYDRSDLSRDFVRKVDASSYFKVLGNLASMDEVTDYLDNGKTRMAIVIPPDWSRQLRSERKAPLQILFDGSDPNYASLSVGYMTRFIETYNQTLLADFLNRRGIERIKPPVEGRVRIWFNEDLESRNFIVPGIIAIIIMIVGAMLTSLVIAREYENGTMETLKALPLTAGEFLLGKAIPYFFIGLADVLMAVLMGQVLFGVIVKGSFWLLIFASSIYLSVALCLGLLISVGTKSQLVANQMAVLITYLPSLLLSDFVFPVANMPKALQTATYIVPAKYFIDILNGLFLRGIGLSLLWPSFLVLAIMSSVLAAITYIAMRKDGL